jgi:hypothetical protein
VCVSRGDQPDVVPQQAAQGTGGSKEDAQQIEQNVEGVRGAGRMMGRSTWLRKR